MAYELFYWPTIQGRGEWPTIQGRGEFVRLALVEAGVEYLNVARLQGRGRGVSAMIGLLERGDIHQPSFAPPFLRDNEQVIGQTANILLYLGSRHGLAGSGRAALNASDSDDHHGLVAEAHDTHHPISVDLYYEDQKPEAVRRAKSFRESRMPKYLA